MPMFQTRVPVLVLLAALTFSACAPRQAAVPQPAFETQVFEGGGSGTFTSAKYRLVLSVNESARSASGVFHNQSAGDDYGVSGAYIPTSGGAELDLTLSQSASAGLNASAGASLLGHTLGAGAGANAAFGRSARLTGTLKGNELNGRLRTVTANYSVRMTRVP